jgi:hypothetical protein
MQFSFSYSNSDNRGNGSTESATFQGDNITLEKLQQVEGLLKKTREDIYKVLQG